MYNWYALSDPRGLAPKGYHLPTYSEWLELLFFLKTPMGKLHLETRNGLLKSSGFYSYNTGIRDMMGGVLVMVRKVIQTGGVLMM